MTFHIDRFEEENVIDISQGATYRHGVIGEIVKIIEPETEADPFCIACHLLVMLGHALGPGPFYRVGQTKHRCNEFLVIVGATSGGRKGTAYDLAEHICKEVFETAWQPPVSGIQTGEGLIAHLSDESTNSKSLLIVEPEFDRVLRCMNREGNQLSSIYRKAWDCGQLQNRTKGQTLIATDPFVGLIAHVTEDELRRRIDATELTNGFLNRFLVVESLRQRFLPFGGDVVAMECALGEPIRKLRLATSRMGISGEVMLGADARLVWEDRYRDLTADGKDPVTAIMARAAPHVIRLSMIYALLDGRWLISAEDLLAALDIRARSLEVVQRMFRGATGNKVADKILAALGEAPGHRLTRSRISIDVLQRNVSQDRIDEALDLLSDMFGVRQYESGGEHSRPLHWVELVNG